MKIRVLNALYKFHLPVCADWPGNVINVHLTPESYEIKKASPQCYGKTI